MRYAILRTGKIKSAPGLARALQHDTRAKTPPNADPAKTQENTIDGNVSQAMSQFHTLTQGVRVRKDSVVAIEYMITASPEAMQGKSRTEQDAYFQDAQAWITKRHGQENILTMAVHRDERTPHLHAVVVPIVQSKDRWGRQGRSMSARSFVGGAAMLREMQTEFAQSVGHRHGLVRGLEGSRSSHRSVREFYRYLEQANAPAPSYELPRRVKPEEVERIILEAYTRSIKGLETKVAVGEADRAALESRAIRLREITAKAEKLEKALVDLPIEEIQKMREKIQAKEQTRQTSKTRDDRGPAR